MSISMYETRTMLPMVNNEKRASSFLRDRFFGNVVRIETKKADIDIVDGKRKIAPFVHPSIGGKAVSHEGYTTNTFEPPETSPMMITTSEDLLMRSPGENIYGLRSPNERAAEQLGKDLKELDLIITRLEEKMCAEALFAGQVTVSGEGYDETVIQYWPSVSAQQPKTTLTSPNRWGDSDVDPTKALREVRRKIIQKSGITPRDAIFGKQAIEAFLESLKNTTLDMRRVDMGMIDPQHLPNGVTYWGYLKDSALDIWSYDEYYLDEDGNEQPMVPEKKVLIGSAEAMTQMIYGPCALMGNNGNVPVFYAEPRVPDSWVQRSNPAGRIVQIKSRPLPVVNQVQAFHVLTPIA